MEREREREKDEGLAFGTLVAADARRGLPRRRHSGKPDSSLTRLMPPPPPPFAFREKERERESDACFCSLERPLLVLCFALLCLQTLLRIALLCSALLSVTQAGTNVRTHAQDDSRLAAEWGSAADEAIFNEEKEKERKTKKKCASSGREGKGREASERADRLTLQSSTWMDGERERRGSHSLPWLALAWLCSALLDLVYLALLAAACGQRNEHELGKWTDGRRLQELPG